MEFIRRILFSPRFIHGFRYRLPIFEKKHLSKDEIETAINHALLPPERFEHAAECAQCKPVLKYIRFDLQTGEKAPDLLAAKEAKKRAAKANQAYRPKSKTTPNRHAKRKRNIANPNRRIKTCDLFAA